MSYSVLFVLQVIDKLGQLRVGELQVQGRLKSYETSDLCKTSLMK